MMTNARLEAPVAHTACTAGYHDELRADRNRFFRSTTPVGIMPDALDDGGALYLANCACGSTLAIPVEPPPCADCGSALIGGVCTGCVTLV